MLWIVTVWACAGSVVESPPTPPPMDPVVPEVVSAPPSTPEFDGSIGPIPADLRRAMDGVSMHPGCPVGFDQLRLLEVSHYDEQREVQRGRIIVAEAVASDVLSVFEALHAARFPVTSLRPVHEFGGSDDRSMEANNTSAFNCRAITGGTSFSQHSYGEAIDLNPLVNPYVRGDLVLPAAGRTYLDRTVDAPGLVREGDPAVRAFEAIGWTWGGSWTGKTLDYQHFSRSGR